MGRSSNQSWDIFGFRLVVSWFSATWYNTNQDAKSSDCARQVLWIHLTTININSAWKKPTSVWHLHAHQGISGWSERCHSRQTASLGKLSKLYKHLWKPYSYRRQWSLCKLYSSRKALSKLIRRKIVKTENVIVMHLSRRMLLQTWKISNGSWLKPSPKCLRYLVYLQTLHWIIIKWWRRKLVSISPSPISVWKDTGMKWIAKASHPVHC